MTLPERTRALLPLAVAPPALAAAILLPATYDPLLPLHSAPVTVWALFFAAAASPAVAIATARISIADRSLRNRTLAGGGALALAATGLAAVIAFLLATPLLVRGGGAWILLLAGAVAVPALAALVVLEPQSLFRWGLFAGECLFATTTAWVLREPHTPDEYLRHVMIAAPGHGPASLGTLLPRLRPVGRDHDARYEARLRAMDATIAQMIEGGAFAPPYLEWGDDAHLVRAWVAGRAASSPKMKPPEAARYLQIAVAERLVFAASPKSSLEPWTRRGILTADALAQTADLSASEDFRIRLYNAWIGVTVLATELRDPALEAEAVGLVRKLVEEEKLDRTHPIYLQTFTLERRRLVEAGDVPQLLAFLDGLAATGLPAEWKKSIGRDAEFIRAHADADYRPVLEVLRARIQANGGYGDVAAARETYRAMLRTWPDASVAPVARAELLELESR